MASTTSFYPELQLPTPALQRDRQRPHHTTSFNKGPRPTAVVNHVDLRRLSFSSAASTLPPAYPSDEESAIPGYGEEKEPHTMARSLFWYGFMFPPFWILGALILVTPLTPDPDWYSTKGESEVQQILSCLRKVERTWAWRCVAAISCLFLIILIIVGSILLAHHFGSLA